MSRQIKVTNKIFTTGEGINVSTRNIYYRVDSMHTINLSRKVN
jgi:hypothetical protein